jgi:sigma-54 dependent transcriptional regulator, acetoin dehydrogenase operon transcriptional activator AcoR
MADALVVQHAEDVLRQVNGTPRPGRDALDTAIGSSWTRCVNEYRLDPSRMYAPTVLDGGCLKDRQAQHDELVAIADAEMESLYDQISGSGYALLLTDASGIILCEKLDPAMRKSFRSAGLLMGADWSEQHEGTNGIGTCIAENRAVTVHRADHFRSRHIGLSCTGAPVRDPSGGLIAVLDASTVGSFDTRASQMHTMALVNLSANLIEKCLFLRRHQKVSVLRFHSRPELVNLLHDGALALAEDGTVLAVDETATRLLGAQHRRDLVGRPLSEIFDVKIEELMGSTSAARQAIWPVRDLRRGRRYFVSLHDGRQRASLPEPLHTRYERATVQVPALPGPQGMSLEDVAGSDPQMLRNVRSARRIANSGVSVLIQGATGSGKEAFARALHLASGRAQQPFVAVNCAAIPETLIESELFGYKSGAFTGARKEGMKGKVLQSSGGTLFLDEIGDMPLMLQTRLLRVLEEHEIVPLGAEAPIKVDLRVICASHRKLREMIERGEFREDLYYRLNGITLELPTLAERADKEALIRRYLAAEAGDQPAAIEPAAFDRLMAYGWPGNIRELRNVIRTALAICEGGIVRLLDLPREIRDSSVAPAPISIQPMSAMVMPLAPERPANPLEAAERDALLRAIEQHRWNMSHTANALGMSRNTLYRKIKHHGIPVATARRELN